VFVKWDRSLLLTGVDVVGGGDGTAPAAAAAADDDGDSNGSQ
jgi:hypothetical protein